MEKKLSLFLSVKIQSWSGPLWLIGGWSSLMSDQKSGLSRYHFTVKTRSAWITNTPYRKGVCVCDCTCLSDAFSPGHLSSPAQLLQLLTLDGVTQVDPRPGEQRSKVKSGQECAFKVKMSKDGDFESKAKVEGFGYFLEFSPAFASSFSTYLSGTNSSQSFTSDSGTFLT